MKKLTETGHPLMDTMTWPAPTTDLPPPPPPKKKISKGWIAAGILVVVGAIGAAANTAKEEAQFDSDINTTVSQTLNDNVTGSGFNETGYIQDTCAAMLDLDLPGTSMTVRSGLADGTTTVSKMAGFFADGYYDSTSDLTRSEVVSACATGLRNG